LKNILLTGLPGVGKTTLIKKLAAQLKSSGAAGFFTEEIREGLFRKGFKVETLNGKTGVLAHVDIESPYRVGKYKVNLEEFEKVGVDTLERSLLEKKRLIVIDEIGKMELFSSRFQDQVLQALNSQAVVVATIGKIANPLIDSIKQRGDVKLIEININNRDKLAEEIVKMLAKI